MNNMKNQMKHIVAVGTLMWAILLSVISCSSSDDFNEPQKEPEKNENLTPGDTERPEWQTASDLFLRYEQTMSVQVTLQKELLPYVSQEDLLCAMVGDEIRGICKKPVYNNDEWLLSLVIAGTGNDYFISIHYYCSKLKKIFKIDRWMLFSQSTPPTLNNGRPYVITFF